jgi:hypothetical protein
MKMMSGKLIKQSFEADQTEMHKQIGIMMVNKGQSIV